MAFVSTDNQELVAVSFKNKLKVFRNNCMILEFANSEESKSKEDNKSKDENKRKSERYPSIDCHQFSHHSKENGTCFLGALTENKKLFVWEVPLEGEIKLLMKMEFPKRPTSLVFLRNEAAALVSDKYGDVYKSIITSETPVPAPTVILGHLSMVLDIEISELDKFILSADRDEKIRISHYPNAYSILNYCLGHKNLVSCIKAIDNRKLVSTSADKTIRLWDFYNGKELSCLDLKLLTGKDFVPTKFVINGSDIILMGEKCRGLVLVTLSENKMEYGQFIDLDFQPVDLCCNQSTGDLYVICANSETPLRMYSKQTENYLERSLAVGLLDELKKLKEDFPLESTYFTNLVKPIRGGKRDSSRITPESTINFEGVYDSSSNSKTQRIEEEEVDGEKNCKMEE